MTDLLPSTAADIERMEGELQALRAELAARNSEFGERIEHQAATIEVLKAMSASPGNAQPVFDLIARQAAKLCNVPTAAVATFDGTMLHLAAQSGFDAANADAYVSQFPRPVGLDFSMGRAVLNRRVDRVEDITADPAHSFGPVLGRWSVMAVPILRDGVPLGAITIGRPPAGPFSDSQVVLLQIFAEQATIAITSAETYLELQERTAALTQRTSEYGERIEHQAATIDVLKTMSASSDDPQPVFDLIARRANELCDGAGVAVFEYDGRLVHFRAVTDVTVDPEARAKYLAMFPMEPTRASITCRAILEKQIIHIPDFQGDPELDPVAKALGWKGQLSVPMMREGSPIGVVTLVNRTGPFTDSQIALLQTFAEQAVIAITSAETYRELQERTAALAERNSEYGERIEQQAATIDVLKVDVSLARRRATGIRADRRARPLLLWCRPRNDGAAREDMLHLHAHSGFSAAYTAEYAAWFPRPVDTSSMFGRAILSRDVVQTGNVQADREHFARQMHYANFHSIVGCRSCGKAHRSARLHSDDRRRWLLR